MKRAVVVISAFNEIERIESLIDYLFSHVAGRMGNWELFVLIVDRGSSDSIRGRIEETQNRHDDLELVAENSGTEVGVAYRRGIREAVCRLNAGVVVELEPSFGDRADLIPLLLQEIDKGFDYVIASGNSSHNTVTRVLLRFMLFFPWYIFSKASDLLAGPRAGRVEGFYDQLDFDGLSVLGHGYRLELLYNLVALRAKVKEIPVQSNVPSATQKDLPLRFFEAAQSILLIRWIDEKTRRFLKFAVVGTIGFLINALALELFYRTQLTTHIAGFFGSLGRFPVQAVFSRKSSWSAAFAAELAIMSNFTLNNLWTFRKNIITKPIALLIKYLTFNATSVGGVIIQFFVVGLATLILGESLFVRQAALVFSIVFLIIPYNWFIYNKVIWRTKHS